MKNYFLKSAAMLIMIASALSCSSSDDSEPEVIKSKVKITAYQINAMPFVAPDGLGWDGINGNPDVYVGFYNGSNLIHVSGTLNDVPTSGLPIGETIAAPYYLVPNFSDNIKFIVMDDDPGEANDDLIGSVTFVMSDYTTGQNKYPTMVSKSTDGVLISLSLIWEE